MIACERNQLNELILLLSSQMLITVMEQFSLCLSLLFARTDRLYAQRCEQIKVCMRV